MERQSRHDERRKAANAFLRELLERNRGKSSEDLAYSITSLALEDSNPVRDFFVKSNARLLPASPPRSLSSRSPSKVLGLARRGAKSISPESKTPTPSQQGSRQRNVSAGLTGKGIKTQNPPDPSQKASYKCIICNEDMSYKGVCKRHLDEQHVSPNLFQCERCSLCFTTKSEAKTHCTRCGNGKCHFNVMKPAPKAIYASEFTDEWFASKTTYLEHLLKLSKHGSLRPAPSLNRKLRTLLSHPSIREHAIDMSEITQGHRDAWKKLRYPEPQLRRIIRQLEDAATADETGSITFERDLNIRHFLHSVLSAGSLPQEFSADTLPPPREQISSRNGGRRSSVSTTIRRGPSPVVMNTYYAPETLAAGQGQPVANGSLQHKPSSIVPRVSPIPRELRVKRHLSDLSNSTEPLRQPPGPPPLALPVQYTLHPYDHPVPDAGFGNQMPAVHLDQQRGDDTLLPHTTAERDVQTLAYSMAAVPNLPLSKEESGPIPVPAYSNYEPHPPQVIESGLWRPEQTLNFHFEFKDSDNGDLSGQDYHCPSEASTRTSSDHTTYVDSSEDEQKMPDYPPFFQHAPGMLGTFLLDEDDYSEMPVLYQQMSGL